MSERDDPRLAVEVGGRTVGAHLDAAIARGGLQFPFLRRVRQALADSLIAVDYGAPNVATHGESRAGAPVLPLHDVKDRDVGLQPAQAK